jgi:hypothetical protein
MEAMRGKRLMFVGDSLNRNQWESLVCLVQSILSKGRKKIVKRGSFNTFYAKEYRATLEFYWAPFLVESNSDNPNFHSIKERIISPERIEAHAKHWKDADYLIFNTYIWWMNNADIKVRSTPTSYSLTGNAYLLSLRLFCNQAMGSCSEIAGSIFAGDPIRGTGLTTMRFPGLRRMAVCSRHGLIGSMTTSILPERPSSS